MRYQQLGTTDLMVSRICFGCWQLSPRFWGEVDLEPWRNSLHAAIEAGVNFIDTADAYGNGFAEEQLGEFLQAEQLRDRFMIATKFYWNFHAEDRHPDTRHDYIIQACEDSLRRLKTDHIDLYQIHAWDPLTRPDEVAAAFGTLRKQGKVRWFGVSNLNAEQMRLYRRHYDIQCLQPPYSLLRRGVEADELPYCLSERIGVIAYSPLFSGLLTGKYQRDQVFDDFRGKNKLFQQPALGRILDALDELRPVADKHGIDLPQLAVRWVLSHPALTSAIVGVKKPEHITGITTAADADLPVDDWHRVARGIDAARKEAEAG